MYPAKVVSMLTKLNIKLPIFQAPMAGATTPQLVAAVANAEGLGSLASGYQSPTEIRDMIKNTRKLTTKPFAVNLFVPQAINPDAFIKAQKITPLLQKYWSHLNMEPKPFNQKDLKSFDEQLEVVIDEKISVVSFAFGKPAPSVINKLKAKNIIIMATATTVEEGIQLEKIGCDIIIAQGSEAGGHRGTFLNSFRQSQVGLMALIPQMIDHVSLPVVAAGGIMDGRGLAAAFVLGASAGQIGTAFLTCPESGISQKYKELILNSTEESTVITKVFSGKPARGIKNKFVAEMEAHEQAIPDYPVQHYLTSPLRQHAAKKNLIEFISLWAGQGTRLNKSKPAGELIIDIANEAKFILSSAENIGQTKNYKI